MQQPIPKNYNFQNIICSGSHSNVTVAEKNDTKEFVAIKSQPSYIKNKKSSTKHRSSHQKHHHRASSDVDDTDEQYFKNSDLSRDIKIVNKKSNLKREAKLYKMLAGAPGFPMYHRFITEGDTDHLIIELLGPNLLSLIKENIQNHTSNVNRLSLKTVLQIADQALLRLQYFHKKGYVHGDVKPENFAIGKFPKSNQIYLIDMSLATRYVNKKNDEHLPFSDKHSCQGSLFFASINSQRGLKPSRRDDLESLGYVLVYLLNGTLPWSNISNSSQSVLYSKINTPVQYLCEGLPPEFEQFINSTRCLSYSDEPDYSYYRQLFRDLFIREGFIYDYIYDWTINDKYKTIISMSASFFQTNPQSAINEVSLSNKPMNYVSKSNIPYYDPLVHLSTHQTADFEMLNCCCHHKNNVKNCDQGKIKDSQKNTHKHKASSPPFENKSNIMHEDQDSQQKATPTTQSQLRNRPKRLILNIKGNLKNNSRNQFSG